MILQQYHRFSANLVRKRNNQITGKFEKTKNIDNFSAKLNSAGYPYLCSVRGEQKKEHKLGECLVLLKYLVDRWRAVLVCRVS